MDGTGLALLALALTGPTKDDGGETLFCVAILALVAIAIAAHVHFKRVRRRRERG